MTQRVTLPPGCDGINMQDGTRYTAPQSGGTITVADHHARAITNQPRGGDAGLVDGRFKGFLGTRKGRWCSACARLWNAWSHECPRCGATTEPDDVARFRTLTKEWMRDNPDCPLAAAATNMLGVAGKQRLLMALQWNVTYQENGLLASDGTILGEPLLGWIVANWDNEDQFDEYGRFIAA